MLRQARIDALGAVHHVMVRGIERRKIFYDNQDHNNWIERMGTVLYDTTTPCFAWALMSNHVHLLLRTGLVPLSTVMQRLLTGYAVSFNRRYRRHGQLFQNRYKSILCQEALYLGELVRYIHLNPLKVDLVKNPSGYGFKWLVGRLAHLLNMEPDEVLKPGRCPRTVMARSILFY